MILCVGLLALCCASLGQVSLTKPKKWATATDLTYHSLHNLELSNNIADIIRKELLDTNTVRLVARHAGITEAELSTIQVAPNSSREGVSLFQLGESKKTFDIMAEQLRRYVCARGEGHTRGFLLAALTNNVRPSAISDPDLRILSTNQALLPLSWLRKVESGTTTNQAGRVVSRTTSTKIVNGKSVTTVNAHVPKVDEVCRWVSYVLVDGEVAWRYFVMFNADDSLNYVRTSKCDAKEYDPNFKKIIEEVDAEVDAQMKKDGNFGKFGSVHSFWDLKKEALKKKGIPWRSPSELNPDTRYD